ncbi:MAG: sigma 54-interacting transcriptional regulator [Planctomycetota bacterium]
MRLEVRLPLGPARAAIRRAWWRMGSMALLGSAAVILAGWTLGGFLQRRELAHRLAQSEQRLQHLRTLERMGAGLAHETKNPLGLVRAQAQRVRGPLRRTGASARPLRIDHRTVRSHPRPLERVPRTQPSPGPAAPAGRSGRIGGRVCDLLQVEAQAQDVRLTFERSAQDDGRGLSADPERLRQVAMNLILNALQICPPGSHVRVAAAARDGAPDFIVDDDGPGVAPELADDLFQPYVSARPGGTGLGLAISQAIARDTAGTCTMKAFCPTAAASACVANPHDPLPVLCIIDDDPGYRDLLQSVLTSKDSRCTAADGRAGLACLDQGGVDLVLLDMRMPGMGGMEFLEQLQSRPGHAPVVVLTAYADVRDAVDAMRAGACDYLDKPVDLYELLSRIRHHLGSHPGQVAGDLPPLPSEWIVRSPLMRDVLQEVHKLASTPVSVLLHGESGSGKEGLARLLHQWGARPEGPFVPVNVAALPETLVEAELFGFERGAFTGAERARTGLLRSADGGTLFLDEVAEMPLPVQAKLLRVLEERQVAALGSTQAEPVDFRLISASHADLGARVGEGHFREDLFYRLAVVVLEVPPLRERPEDLLPLAELFVRQTSRTEKRLSPEAIDRLRAYPGPATCASCRSAVARAAILSVGSVILPEHLPPPCARPACARAINRVPRTSPPWRNAPSWTPCGAMQATAPMRPRNSASPGAPCSIASRNTDSKTAKGPESARHGRPSRLYCSFLWPASLPSGSESQIVSRENRSHPIRAGAQSICSPNPAAPGRRRSSNCNPTMLNRFRSARLSTKVITFMVTILIITVALNYTVFMTRYKASAEQSLVDEAAAHRHC